VVKVPQMAWFGPRELELSLPSNWQITVPYMQGYDRPELKPEEIKSAIRNPIGTSPLSELARGKKEAAIVFDDLTRVTRAAKIVPFILEELAEAGIADDNIRFIAALGLHGVMYRSDLVKKLGEEVVSRFRIFNHNAFGNCAYAGTTKTFGTRVNINEEYLKCDLKIAIGSCVPHPAAGFGGGSKLILPGIASVETVKANHGTGGVSMEPMNTQKRPTHGMGIVEGNLLKKDIDEAAELAGLDFCVNAINNLWGEPAAIYAGDWKLAFKKAVEDATRHYRTPKIENQDVVISNSYAKASESIIALSAAIPMINRGGDIVVIANAPEGQVTHYLAGMFGKTTYACLYKECEIPPQVHRVMIFSEYPHRGSSWFADNEKITYFSRWSEVLKALGETHGPGTRATVIPDATNQYFEWYERE
jgi:nickel-dependent lactate racemase